MPLDDTGFRDRFDPLDKIDRVIELLATKERWCQGAFVMPDGRRCLIGAIRAVDGTPVLTRPISIAIRQVTGRRFAWIDSYNIPRFNDNPATTHALVLRVLFQARENIISGVVEHNVAPTWRERLSRLHRILPIS